MNPMTRHMMPKMVKLRRTRFMVTASMFDFGTDIPG
jgi:hypothetical protein